MTKFSFNSRVQVKSFHGLEKDAAEKSLSVYEKLIGQTGIVVSENQKLHPAYPEKGTQVMIKFDINLSDIGIDSHNEIHNSLWIFVADLVEEISHP